MPAYFYLSQNTNSDEPEALKATEGYVHVKAHTSGAETVVLTSEKYNGHDATALTFDGAQALLDEWIAEENANAPLDPEGNPILQQRINLSAYVVDGGENA